MTRGTNVHDELVETRTTEAHRATTDTQTTTYTHTT